MPSIVHQNPTGSIRESSTNSPAVMASQPVVLAQRRLFPDIKIPPKTETV